MNEPKFKPGDQVKHLGSGQHAVIVRVGRGCREHVLSPKAGLLTYGSCVESDPSHDCDFGFNGLYWVSTGVGEKNKEVNEEALALRDLNVEASG